MQKRYVLALVTVAGVALLSAQQGPACPYQDAERSAATSADAAVSEGSPAEGSLLGFGRSSFLAP